MEAIFGIYESGEAYYVKYNNYDLDFYRLFYYNGKEEEMLTDQLKRGFDLAVAATNKPVIIYNTKDNICVAKQNKISTIDRHIGYRFFINSEGSLIYYLDGESDFSYLYKVQITDNRALTAELFDTNVGNDCVLYAGDQLLYYRNIHEEDNVYKGDLCRNKEMIWENVDVSSISYDEETSQAKFGGGDGDYYCNEEQLYDKKKAEQLGNDIYTYLPTSGDRILYVSKKSEDTEGILYTYADGEKKRLVEGVTDVFYARHYIDSYK